VLISALVLGFLLFQTASANVGNCIEPQHLAVPNSIHNADDASAWLARLEEYSTESTVFFECLLEYATLNDATLTKKERSDLERAFQLNAEELRAVTDKWNRAYGQYLKRVSARQN
jgi:hypothetical protein